jgi:signal peptidase II
LFWGIALTVLVVDAVTKYLAVQHLALHLPKRVIGNVVRFTLAYNPGAAFSMSLGGPGTSRLVFGLFACIALFALWRIYKGSKPENRLRVIAVALAWGG